MAVLVRIERWSSLIRRKRAADPSDPSTGLASMDPILISISPWFSASPSW